MNFQIGIWSDKLQSRLIDKNDNTSYVDSSTHDGPVFKFPAGRPAIGDVVCCIATWDAVLRRGSHRQVVRRVIRVKPATAKGGEGELWLGEPAERSLLLGGNLALRRDSIPVMPCNAIPPVVQSSENLPEEFSTWNA